MERNPFRKEWLASSGIARGMLGTKAGERIPTIEEYTKQFGCSRGVVQNALATVEKTGAIRLEKRGKNGTYLAEKDEEKLFKSAGLQFFTGSMPTPMNIHLAGLATGICQAMARCTIPYTFAFVQGSRNRAEALCREVYDFAIVTKAAAAEHVELYPQLEVAFELQACEYSQPYTLFINKPNCTEVEDGMVLAVDPNSTDQWELTNMLCEGKRVKLVELPYIATGTAFLAGEVDAVVQRKDIAQQGTGIAQINFTGDSPVSLENISLAPISGERALEMQLPVVLVNSRNYGIAAILKNYLDDEVISYVQRRVINHQMAPQFY